MLSLFSRICRWLFLLLIAYGFAALISTIVAALVPPLPIIAVGPLLCPASATAILDYGRSGKYSSYHLLCTAADGNIVAQYSDLFQVVWATYWVVPVVLLGYYFWQAGSTPGHIPSKTDVNARRES